MWIKIKSDIHSRTTQIIKTEDVKKVYKSDCNVAKGHIWVAILYPYNPNAETIKIYRDTEEEIDQVIDQVIQAPKDSDFVKEAEYMKRPIEQEGWQKREGEETYIKIDPVSRKLSEIKFSKDGVISASTYELSHDELLAVYNTAIQIKEE